MPITTPASTVMTEAEWVQTAIQYTAMGMKPLTVHKLYILEFDISTACTPKNGVLGGQIITDAEGRCEFTYHHDQAMSISIPGVTDRYRRTMWTYILTEILTRNYGRGYGFATPWYNLRYETVLKNAAGDSTARASFGFTQLGERRYIDGRLVLGYDYGGGSAGEGSGGGGYIFEPNNSGVIGE
jgi:hypothetical protein